MFISITCRCEKQLRVKYELAGKRIRCLRCRATLIVPVTRCPHKVERNKRAIKDADGTSLRQLILSIGGFLVAFAAVLGFFFVLAMHEIRPANGSLAHYLAITILLAGPYGGHKLGGLLYPASQYGSVNVRKIVWSIVSLLLFALVVFILIAR